jgi:hypothetical protein
MSSALGADAQQLARFKTTPDLPSLGSYGAFAPQFLDKLVKQKSIGEQLTDVRGRYAQVAAEKGEDSQEAKDLFDLNKKLTDYKTNLEPKEATWASRMDALRIKYADAKLAGKTGEMSEIEKQMNAHLEAYNLWLLSEDWSGIRLLLLFVKDMEICGSKRKLHKPIKEKLYLVV